MNIRMWGISLFMFLSTVSAVGQTANRYLKAPLPDEWEESGQVFQQTLPVDDYWWKSFRDTKLDSLIALAVDRNFSVAMAINRISAARANLWMERSNFFPSIGLNAGWTREETSGNISAAPQSTEHYYGASLSMSWEVDVFGSIRKRVKAQKENFAASKEEYTGVMISMAAEVASAYINLREFQQQLEVVKKNVASQEKVLKITEVRYNTGLVAKLDVAQAKSVLYSTRASIPQLEAGINQYITTLAVLLGMYPQEIRPGLETVGTLPDYMEPIGVGMPVDLLLRRPDVRSAERNVNAQAALLGASKADWLPKVFLKGSFGYAARDLKDLVKSKSMTYEIAPALSWTIFSGGQLVNATRLAKAQLDETINQFNQTVLTAVQETDNAMNAYRNSIKQIVALREVRNQGVETLKLSLELYKQGLSPFQNVLDAQRSLLSYENQLVQAEGSSLLQLITLYKALGGGWRE
ncbi:TolC family protein [Bacteroides sp.]|uniref:efflux transporter outer membrane subunit n=1 Tax=Bacteroides sp. TaxID=29523 RepID=UPI00258C1FB5|nr:TolC family protein [Bacteroides sp.]